MSARAILAERKHRPWPLPRGPWVMTQTWSALLFAHWPLDPRKLRPLLPAALPLDTFEGEAWVGIVPFQMSRVHPRGVPAVPGLSAFPELNVRTYVTLNGKPGVWFFSLDAGNRVAVALARSLFHLPYYRAHMRCRPGGGEAITYSSERVHAEPHPAHPAAFAATYRPVGPAFTATPGTLVHWLTERYCLYTLSRNGALIRDEIHHRPWRLRPAEATFTRETMARANGLALPGPPPLLHYAEPQRVLVWSPHPVRDGKRS